MFFQSKSFLGVDIGTVSIKMVEISRKRGNPFLKNYGYLETYGHLERLNDAIQTGSLKLSEKETAQLLKFLVKKIKPKTNKAVISFPSFAAFITLIETPLMPEEDLEKTIPFQSRQYIPLPISEVSIDWLKVGEKEEKGVKKQQILLVSIPNEKIETYKRIFKAADLDLVSLEMETFSLIRVLLKDEPMPTILVDIGGFNTNIGVIEKGFLKYNSRTDMAGNSLTQAISRGLNIEIKRAEELKKRCGLLAEKGEREVSSLIEPFLDAIIKEIEKTKEIYQKEYGIEKIERVFLIGGGAELLGIEDYFRKQLNLSVFKGDPFSKISYPPEIEPALKQVSSLLGIAVGLGIRELI